LKDHTQIIPALDKTNRSPWPEKYPPSWFLEKKRKSGTIIFNAQYQCDTEAMKGEIFQYDDCQDIDEKDIPTDLEKFIGIDLAIAEKEKSDMFAVVTIGVDKMQNIYALDYFAGHLRFARQTEKILEIYGKHDPVRACIETNAYQAAQYQTLMDVDSHLRIKPVDQHKDKITRAWKLSSIFEDKKVFFRKGLHILKEHMVLFPNGEKDDLFDAFDLAVRASRMRNRRKRRSEPGLL
jgi:phage terminase large subunit-like protein